METPTTLIGTAQGGILISGLAHDSEPARWDRGPPGAIYTGSEHLGHPVRVGSSAVASERAILAVLRRAV